MRRPSFWPALFAVKAALVFFCKDVEVFDDFFFDFFFFFVVAVVLVASPCRKLSVWAATLVLKFLLALMDDIFSVSPTKLFP